MRKGRGLLTGNFLVSTDFLFLPPGCEYEGEIYEHGSVVEYHEGCAKRYSTQTTISFLSVCLSLFECLCVCPIIYSSIHLFLSLSQYLSRRGDIQN